MIFAMLIVKNVTFNTGTTLLRKYVNIVLKIASMNYDAT